MNDKLAYDLDGLAVDVFSVIEGSAAVESLTGAHGMTELSASCPTCGDLFPILFCSGSCSAAVAP